MIKTSEEIDIRYIYKHIIIIMNKEMIRIVIWIRNEPRLIDNHLFEWARQVRE